MAQYVVTILRIRPQSATDEPRYHESSFFKKHSSTQLYLNVFIFWFLRANFLRLLHDYIIFDVSLIEFTNFSSNIVITFNNKLW